MKENQMNIYQKRFWQEWLFDEESDKYNLWSIYNIFGCLDEKKLIDAINKLIDDYSVFRFNCSEKDGEIFCHNNIRKETAIDFIDLSEIQMEDKNEARRKTIDQYARKPFDLRKFPLYRNCLIKLSTCEYTLILCFHHILVDGHTLKAIREIISAYYNDKVLQRPYEDTWSNGLANIDLDAKDESRKVSTEYWFNQFADINPCFNLGVKVDRLYVRGTYKYLSLGKERTERFIKFCKDLKATPFCVLMSLYAGLLSRYFCEENFAILYSVNMRNKSFKHKLGSFVNNIPLVFKEFDEKKSLRCIIEFVTVARASDKVHQAMILSDLVDKLRADKKIENNNLFNVSLDETCMRLEPLTLRKVVVKAEKIVEQDIIGDWNLAYEFIQNQLHLRLHYVAKKFSAEFADRFLDAFVRLFDAVLLNPAQDMASFKVLSGADWQKFVDGINSRISVYPKQELLHQLFERQVCLSPDAVVLACGSHTLTYHELNEQANRVARFLRKQGVREGSIVGVLLPKSINILVALLGVLKAGGAYLPLDVAYPEDRLRFMMLDSEAEWLITEAEFEKNGKALSNKILIIDKEMDVHNFDGKNLDVLLSAENFAYMIYTSGSTGTPKGVVINHANIVARAYDLAAIYKVDSNHRHLHLSSFSFDASLEELFLPIMKGGMVIIPPRGANIDMPLLIKSIHKHQVSCINFVPSLLELFLDEVEQNSQQGCCSSLKTIIVGGESLSAELVNRCHQNFSAILFNTYGPTENTIDSTYYCFNPNYQYQEIPIGKPLPNSSVYVLDSKKRIAPIGVAGELYVGGVGVSPGYFHRDELTQEKFVSKNFIGREERLYRTGDLVRFLEDGNLIFLSRIDNQVKLRGLRIELGEIESKLRSYVAVKQAAVCVKRYNGADTLIAYYTSSKAIAKKDLLNYLRKDLPVYMLPSFCEQVDFFPLLPNGKLNYDALPLPQDSHNGNPNQLETVTEQIVFDACAEILGFKSIAMNDNFFALGGNSLKGAQIIARIRQKTNKQIPVQYIFDYPTFSELAAAIDEMDILATKKISFQHHREYPAKIPLSHLQERLCFIFSVGVPVNIYNIPLVFKLSGQLKIEKLEDVINEIVARHSIYRTSFVKDDIGMYQVVHDKAVIKIMRHFVRNEKDEDCLIHQFIEQDFVFDRAPLIKVSLLESSSNNYILLINFHHLIADGWTIDLFIEELNFYYNGTAGDTFKSNNIPYQYYDYVHWFARQEFSQSMLFWKQYLPKNLELINFPTDKQIVSDDILKGRTIEFMIPADVCELAHRFGHQYGATPFAMFLSIFQIFIYFYTRQEKIIVGTVVANRLISELEAVHGFFANTLPLFCEINPDNSFAHFLKENAHTLSRVLSNQDVPLADILSSVKLSDGAPKDLLFRFMFIFQNVRNVRLQLKDVRTLSSDVKSISSKFDFAMFLEEASSGCFKGRIEFNGNKFQKKTVLRYVREYIYLARQIFLDPNRAILKHSLILPRSRKYLATLNDTYKNLGHDELLFQQFDRNAKLFPDKKALADDKKSLSYGSLYQQSNKIANFLLGSGVQRNDFIAVYSRKCCEQIVAVLGINKAGCAYIPLSIYDPEMRLSNVLRESKTHCVLVEKELQGKISWASDLQVFVIEEILERNIATIQPSLIQQPSDLAYVIYTSGSTGMPKGVMIDHAGALNTIRDINARFNVGANDAIFAISSLNFDLSVYDIFGALSAGATLILPNDMEAKEPSAWLEIFSKHRITIWNSVPTFLQMLCEYLQSFSNLSKYFASMQSLRLFLLSGDWIPVVLPKQIISLFGKNAEIVSLGGATEASIWSILYPIGKTDRCSASIPYGKPMWNQQVYILDSNLKMVPIGSTGELYIGGKGVAKGYLNDRDRTEASFVKHPETNELIYKTGDIGRYQIDGNIEFLGRKDFQVKINGFRVELGEIEAKLNMYDLVSKSLVVFDSDLKQILAYFVAKYPKTDAQVIENYMRQILPHYMLPAKYIEIEKIPLNANGKIDKKLLPKSDRPNLAEKIEPTQPLELKISEIWRSLLHLQELFLCDNFFELGGHSLIATQLISKILSVFNIEMSIRDVFLYPTLKLFTERLAVLLSKHCQSKHNVTEGVL